MIDAKHLAEALFIRRLPLRALHVQLMLEARPGVYWLFRECTASTFWEHLTYVGRANRNLKRRLLVQVKAQGDENLWFTVCYAPKPLQAYRLESWALRVARAFHAPLLNQIEPAGIYKGSSKR